MIEYRKGDLFDAPSGSILAHACNAFGVWGSGIARLFRQKFPASYDQYRAFCDGGGHGRQLVGRAYLTSENVACLITSRGYGGAVDSPSAIVEATERALGELFECAPPGAIIHMPKINSGLFGVPWESTELAVERALSNFKDYEIKIVVWEP